MAIKFLFVGDIMLSRSIGLKYSKEPYQIISTKIKKQMLNSDFCVGNLESPVYESEDDFDHLVFNSKKNILKEITEIDFLSLANNHINDCGEKGIVETIKSLKDLKFHFNGVYEKKYKPFTVKIKGVNFAFFTATDMMNVQINHELKVPLVDDKMFEKTLKKYKLDGYIIIFYAHMGQLFSRFPNPKIRTIARKYIDHGADLVLTVHPHLLGGTEIYNEKKIIYSLGDFVMDGNSYRRRRSCLLKIDFCPKEMKFKNFNFLPTFMDNDLKVDFSNTYQKKRTLKSWSYVSRLLKRFYNSNDYESFYKFAYKKEILKHNFATILFIIREKGLYYLFLLLLKRFDEVKMMVRWLFKDRTSLTRDDEAIMPNRKINKIKDLF